MYLLEKPSLSSVMLQYGPIHYQCLSPLLAETHENTSAAKESSFQTEAKTDLISKGKTSSTHCISVQYLDQCMDIFKYTNPINCNWLITSLHIVALKYICMH